MLLNTQVTKYVRPEFAVRSCQQTVTKEAGQPPQTLILINYLLNWVNLLKPDLTRLPITYINSYFQSTLILYLYEMTLFDKDK